MQSGFSLLEMGSSTPGNEVHIMVKNVVDVVFGSLSYWLLGYGISFGHPSNPFTGLGGFAPNGGYDPTDAGLQFSRYIFQFSFAATSTTIVSGCAAMRMRFGAYCFFSFFVVIFYSFVAHWTWADDVWLNALGVHDFAGGGPVHLFGGVNGLVAVVMLGPRTGRFDSSRPKSDFRQPSPTSTLFGLFMLWWGWIGFNCGSTFGITGEKWVVATRAAIVTINSTGKGGLFSIAYSLLRTKRRHVLVDDVVNGMLGSLVATSPTCAVVHTYEALVIGAVGAAASLSTNHFVKRRKLDDPAGGVGFHLGGAVWGLFAVGLFADGSLPGIDVRENGLFHGGGFLLLGLQCLAVVSIVGWGLVCSGVIFYVVGVCNSRDWRDPRSGLRVTREEEMLGADRCMHGIAFEDDEKGDDDSFPVASANGRDCLARKGHSEDEDDDNLDECNENVRRSECWRKWTNGERSDIDWTS